MVNESFSNTDTAPAGLDSLRRESRLIVEPGSTAEILPTLFLISADAIACVLALALSSLIFKWPDQFAMVLLTGVVSYGVGAALFGLYPGRGMLGPARIRLRSLLALISFLSPAVVFAALHRPDFQMDIATCLTACVLLAFLGSLLELVAIWISDSVHLWRAPAIFLGDAETHRKVAQDLETFPELGLRLVSAADLQSVALVPTGPMRTDVRHAAFLVDTAAPLPTFFPMRRSSPNNRLSHEQRAALAVKRMMDVAIALLLLVLVSPLLLVTTLAIMLRDGRPIFYSQNRGGKDGKTIRVWKFRSMYRDAEARLARILASDEAKRAEWERFFKLRDDPRILPGIGNLIRKASIDELPQLWNVLRGDMSMVGPRPFPPEHLAAFSTEFQDLRSTVIPGISGLWQVTLRSDGDLDEQERLDRAYIEGWSMWLDIYIALRTPLALLGSRGAR